MGQSVFRLRQRGWGSESWDGEKEGEGESREREETQSHPNQKIWDLNR